jgi:hypothetical protein
LSRPSVNAVTGSSSRGGSGQPAAAIVARALSSALVHGSAEEVGLPVAVISMATSRQASTSPGNASRWASKQIALDGGWVVLSVSGSFPMSQLDTKRSSAVHRLATMRCDMASPVNGAESLLSAEPISGFCVRKLLYPSSDRSRQRSQRCKLSQGSGIAPV